MQVMHRADVALLVVVALAAALVSCTRASDLGDAPKSVATSPGSTAVDGQVDAQARVPRVEPDRPLRAHGRPVKPESFGAVGDGAADDTAALQQALDAASTSRSPVRLSRDRTYLVSRALHLPSGTDLRGAGPSSVMRFTWSYNDAEHDGFYLGNQHQTGSGDRDITLVDFAIRGTATGLPAGANDLHHKPRIPAIRLRLVDRFLISGIDISFAPGISIIHQGCANGTITGNRIRRSGRDGINGTWHERNMHDILIANNEITKVGDDGIAVIGTPGNQPNRKVLPYRILVRDNVIRGWRHDPNGLLLGRGITVMAANQVGVVGNRIVVTHSAGILVAPSTRPFSFDPVTRRPWRSSQVSIVDNLIREAGRSYQGLDEAEHQSRGGVVAKQTDQLWMSGNSISQSLGPPVALYDCRGCVRAEAD